MILIDFDFDCLWLRILYVPLRRNFNTLLIFFSMSNESVMQVTSDCVVVSFIVFQTEADLLFVAILQTIPVISRILSHDLTYIHTTLKGDWLFISARTYVRTDPFTSLLSTLYGCMSNR